jgi:hypothetical protein
VLIKKMMAPLVESFTPANAGAPRTVLTGATAQATTLDGTSPRRQILGFARLVDPTESTRVAIGTTMRLLGAIGSPRAACLRLINAMPRGPSGRERALPDGGKYFAAFDLTRRRRRLAKHTDSPRE